MKRTRPKLELETCSPPQATELETCELFDKEYRDVGVSAIDKFFEKSRQLNKLVRAGEEKEQESLVSSLILLGYVSAVESYLREMIRRLIVIDDHSRKTSETKQIAYGAVTAHEEDMAMLPEALLERFSFAGTDNVIRTFREFLGFKGDPPLELKEVLRQYSCVCQLRHCVVHRFGRLGSNNAIELGLADHRESIEKPLQLDYAELQNILLVCTNTVKVVNSFLFETVMARSGGNELGSWSWDAKQDEPLFQKYYDLFFSALEPAENAPSAKTAYKEFKKTFATRRPI